VATLSLTGIAGASAADVGTAQTQYGNHHTVQKHVKAHVKYFKIVNNSTKKQNKTVKKLNPVEKTVSSKNLTGKSENFSKLQIKNLQTTQNKNTSESVAKKVKSKKHNQKVTTKKYTKKLITKKHAKKATAKKVTTKKHKTGYKYTSNSSKQYAAAGSYKKVKRSTSANTSSIKALAHSLTKGTGSQYKKGTKVFNWVRDHLSYKFYYNTRYGANGALKYRTGNCADQAHLVVALARSSGLQARYVHGKAHFRSGHWYGHVWAQVKANGKWYTADPTSNRNSFGVARNWNAAKVKGIYKNLPF
jgi:hypothetical protein